MTHARTALWRRPGAWPGVLQGALAGATVVALLAGPGLLMQPADSRHPTSAAPRVAARVAAFGTATPSAPARQVADWVARSADNQGREFVIIDKQNAMLYVFDAAAQLRAATPVLLGSALGDDSFPGVGNKPVAQVSPQERTTPAGRFDSEPGVNAQHEDVVWIDYDAAVSMHRLRATDVSERRRERMASSTAEDNRISYGCVNVPQAFYEQYVLPAFGKRRGVVYVLPDVKPLEAVFGAAVTA